LVERVWGEEKRNSCCRIAAVIWSIWKTRNLACLEKKWPDEPYVVILKICYYINYWSLLQVKEDARSRLEFCAKVLERVVMEVFGSRRSWISWTPRLMV
jgi:hypothetical protein